MDPNQVINFKKLVIDNDDVISFVLVNESNNIRGTKIKNIFNIRIVSTNQILYESNISDNDLIQYVSNYNYMYVTTRKNNGLINEIFYHIECDINEYF